MLAYVGEPASWWHAISPPPRHATAMARAPVVLISEQLLTTIPVGTHAFRYRRGLCAYTLTVIDFFYSGAYESLWPGVLYGACYITTAG
jgi:hypothetical protein